MIGFRAMRMATFKKKFSLTQKHRRGIVIKKLDILAGEVPCLF
jgi:hypothetical protein